MISAHCKKPSPNVQQRALAAAGTIYANQLNGSLRSHNSFDRDTNLLADTLMSFKDISWWGLSGGPDDTEVSIRDAGLVPTKKAE